MASCNTGCGGPNNSYPKVGYGTCASSNCINSDCAGQCLVVSCGNSCGLASNCNASCYSSCLTKCNSYSACMGLATTH